MIETVLIDKLVHRGLGLGRRTGGQAVFVPFVVPGEEVRIRLATVRKSYAVGELLDVRSPAPERRDPPCPYYGRCGGCQLMHMRYAAQLHWKKRIVEENWPDGPPVQCGSRHGREFEYRRRVRLQVSGDQRGVGFARLNTNDIVIISDCPVCAPPIRRLFPWLHDELLPRIRQEQIMLEQITIIVGNEDAPVLFLHARRPVEPSRRSAIQATASFPVAFQNQPDPPPQVELDFGALRLTVAPDAFFQAFPAAAAEVAEHPSLALPAETRLLELYSGVGLFSLVFSRRVRSVRAVEGDLAARRLFPINQRRARANNVAFAGHTVERWLAGAGASEPFDAVFLDPPRTGVDPAARSRLGASAARTLLYLSCEIATQRRDIRPWLVERRLSAMTVFDFFPNTFHVECLARVDADA
jgi:23S rRNA (uracil1939-C5)-methyltransferase